MTSDRLIAGRYRITDPIGTGAMGVVWRGTDVRLRRTVAVKQLLLAPNLTRTAAIEARLRAMREGRIAARLHHPNAITVFDVAEEDGQPWLVMEYMDAPSLAAKLSGHRTLPAMEVARIGAQAAAALAAAHDAGIMHRDVKPANLLVGDDGTVKITDFGISRAVGDVTVTATGFLAGTPAYLAPEVARGEDPESASDVFALGSTLYAAVEGSPPFGEGDNPLAVLHAVARGEIPPPKKAGALGPVLLRLLAPTTDARPTMREAQDAMEAVAAGRAPALAPTPATTKVMPAPEADATTVLPGPKAGAVPDPASETTTADAAVPAATAVPTPTPPNAAGDTPPGTSGDEQSRARLIAVAAIAVVAVLVVVGLVLASNSSDDSPTATAPTGDLTSTADAPNVVAPGQQEPVAPRPPTATTRPPATTTPFGPPTADRIAQFVQGYYGMVPGNLGAAWTELSPAYQAQTGGYDAYARFWNSIRSVSVGAVTPNGENRAVVSLTYNLKDGSTSSENRWIQVVPDNGRLLIAASGT
ncbi:serine/threonine-protein kinase [Nocardia australiensis]|uniref:serine/threonine-protein kinase n=1 Tax=Nocardia australiensis TaxID=2887191 RepID=UPI001D1560B6|nr:serine/threonine-protein kinase [Nocardia australiensis]